MNYLVQLKLADRPTTPQEGIVFIEQDILPTLELCNKLEADKKIVAGGIKAVRTRLEQLKTQGGAR